MGVQGLWKLLEDAAQPTGLETLAGQIVAVDAAVWVYQATLGAAPGTRNPQLALFLNRICAFLAYRVLPVFVFDGPHVPELKKRVLAEREVRRAQQEVTITRKQRALLEKLARHGHNDKDVQRARDAFAAPAMKAARTGERLFGNFAPDERPRAETIDLSDDDEEVVVLREQRNEQNDEGEVMKELREQVREQRLRPEHIPHRDSDQFSRFQLLRCLDKGRLNKKIEELSKPPPSAHIAKEFKFSECGLRTHRYVRFEEEVVVVAEEPEEREETNARALALTLSIFESTGRNTPKEELGKDEERDECPEESERELAREETVKKQINADFELASRMAAEDVDLGEMSSSPDSTPTRFSSPGPSRPAEEEGEADKDSGLFTDSPPAPTREDQAFGELKEMLSLCGLPFVVARGEAEAQCAWWQQKGAVDAVFSDDSDSLLFGASLIYRHAFSKKEHMQRYDSSSVLESTGLSRGRMAVLALISGSDYSTGLRDIGAKKGETIVKLLSEDLTVDSDEIEALSILERLRKLLLEGGEANAALAKLRDQMQAANSREELERVLNEDILHAYFSPVVDRLPPASFHFEFVNLKRLSTFLERKLGWDADKQQRVMGDVLRQWNKHLIEHGHEFFSKKSGEGLKKRGAEKDEHDDGPPPKKSLPS